MKHLQDLHVLVLGLGASGLAMARWCAWHGAHVTVADTREAPPQLAALREAVPAAAFLSGPFTAALVEGTPVRAVYRSPGLAPAALAPVVDAARAMGLVVGGELDLFAQALADLRAAADAPKPAVLAITGTNGKTTVTALTGQLVARAGKGVAVAGNIGPTLLDTLTERLDAGMLPEVWVLELSSFQLDGVQGFEPTAAAVLNLTQDHLDWHGDMAAYAAAKARIFGTQGLMVLNRDDPAVMQMLPAPVKVKLQRPQQRVHISFGAGLPQRPGDFGIERVDDMAWLVRAHEADETQKRKRGAPAEEQEIHLQRLMPADALRIRGQHNALNALAALALAGAAGCALGPMLYGLREYRGEPHRVEPVALVDGVEYFDDSKGTNVGATVAALGGLGAERSAGPPQASERPLGAEARGSEPAGAGSDGPKGRPVSGRLDQRGHEVPSVGATFDRRIVAILGGEGKGQDFSPLAEPVQRYARAVVLIGRDAPSIEAALAATGVALLHAATLPEAVKLAAASARAGDAVLLSPACASFDMFQDYAHRAAVFCAAVQTLSEAPSPASEANV